MHKDFDDTALFDGNWRVKWIHIFFRGVSSSLDMFRELSNLSLLFHLRELINGLCLTLSVLPLLLEIVQSMKVQFLEKHEDGYLEWFITVSHPYIIPPTQPVYDVGPFLDGELSNGVPLPPPSMTVEQRIQRITLLSDNLVDLEKPDSETCLGIANNTHYP